MHKKDVVYMSEIIDALNTVFNDNPDKHRKISQQTSGTDGNRVVRIHCSGAIKTATSK